MPTRSMLVVLGGQAADDQLALLVGVRGQLHVVDRVAAAGLLVAVGHGRVVGAARLVEHVPVDGPGAAAALAAAAGRQQRQRERRDHSYGVPSVQFSLSLGGLPTPQRDAFNQPEIDACMRRPAHRARRRPGRSRAAARRAPAAPGAARAGGVDGHHVRAAPVGDHAGRGLEQLEALAEAAAAARSARARAPAWSPGPRAAPPRCAPPGPAPGATASPVLKPPPGLGVPLHRVAVAVAAGAVVQRLAGRAVELADLVALVEERRAGQRQQQHRRARARSRAPKRVASRPKSWFDITQAAPGRLVVASIARRSGSASQGDWSSSNANTASKWSR